MDSQTHFSRAQEVLRLRNQELTRREILVLSLVADGLCNRDIAANMFVQVETTRWHLRSLYRKAGVRNRQELQVFAAQYFRHTS